MPTTITGNVSTGIILNPPGYSSPIIIEPGQTIGGYNDGYAIYAPADPWTVINYGAIANAGGAGGGIRLADGGAVTNETSGVIGSTAPGSTGIYILGGPGTVANAGAISSVWLQSAGSVTNQGGAAIVSGSTSGGYGVGLHAGGNVTNAGEISGLLIGVDASYDGGTVINQAGGTITGHYAGVLLVFPGQVSNGPGSLTNQAGGTIVAEAGVLAGAGDTVTNAGTISGTAAGTVVHQGVTLVVGAGVSMTGAGVVANQPGGTISGASFGVYFGAGGGTVFDAGVIVGGNGTAVGFAGAAANLLVLDPGFSLSGLAVGSPGASNTLELASGASAGALSGLGSRYLNFTETTIDVGATWTLSGSNVVAAGQTMTNAGSLKLLGAALTIDGALINNGTIGADPSSLTAASIGGVGAIDIGADSTLVATGTVSAGQTIAFTGANAVLTVLHSGQFAGAITGQGPTDTVTMACFAAGTRIAVAGGSVPVEHLATGDIVVSRFAGLAPVRWIGHRRIDCRRHPNPRDVWPVRVRAGAFGAGLPRRDLLLSPDHAVFVEGALIPIRYLVNDRTIAQQPLASVIYYHVELPSHDVILAEGLPCESYLDTGNRAAFADGEREPAFAPPPPAGRPAAHM